VVVPLLAVACYAVALAQHPGDEFTDSRIELSVDPLLFLERVTQVWSPTSDLGHVHSGQSVGYLFPMGPWYALADMADVPIWIAERIWLGSLLAAAAVGVVRLLDALYPGRRGVAHLTAGVLFAFNPYVAVFTNRATVALLVYAALPWLLLAAHRGAREPRGWRWPAIVGLIVAATGGGTNATLVVFVVPAPLALLLYERFALGLPRGAAWRFGWRAAVCAVIASAWWVIPLALALPYGADFLSFTEQPTSIWTTNSMSEVLRLLGYWPTYLLLGLESAEPFIRFASLYLFEPVVIVGTFLVPLLALGGLYTTRRWPYAPLFGLLTCAAAVTMAAGFPDGSPPRAALLWLY